MSSEAHLLELLRKRYPAPAWAFFDHVADATGHAQKRTIDAVAMGVWPSKGLDLHAFEIKCSRNDFRRELDKPEKAAGWAELVDYFWFVVSDDSVAKVEEIPGRWGLLSLSNGKKPRLVVRRPASLHRCETLDRFFIAALLRKAAKVAAIPEEHLRSARERGRQEGRNAERAEQLKEREMRKAEERKFHDIIDAFNKATGLYLPTYRPDPERGRELGEQVAAARRVLAMEPDPRLVSAARTLREITTQLEVALEVQAEMCAENRESKDASSLAGGRLRT